MGRRIGGIVAAIVVVALIAWGVLHVVITPVNPDQEPPSEHVGGSCLLCHMVVSSAETIEVE